MARKLSPPEIMRNLAIGYWVSRLVHVAAKLRLADLLKGGSRSIEDLASARGVAQRCRLESGNFFEAVPKGGDAYIMKYILHDWNDDECVKILANCRAAMNEKGKVLVVDNVVSAGNDPSWGKLLDIQMLIIGGRERTKEEFAALFAAAGLKLVRIVPTKCPLSIVEGVRV